MLRKKGEFFFLFVKGTDLLKGFLEMNFIFEKKIG